MFQISDNMEIKEVKRRKEEEDASKFILQVAIVVDSWLITLYLVVYNRLKSQKLWNINYQSPNKKLRHALTLFTWGKTTEFLPKNFLYLASPAGFRGEE